MRGVGITAALRELPDVLLPVFAVFTQLGDVWFVFTVLGVLYAVGDRLPFLALARTRAAFVLALALGGLALTIGLKAVFGFPRPPAPGSVTGLRYVPAFLHDAYVGAATASGYGFPSGHALLSTVFWGGLAAVLDVGTRSRRAIAAGIVVATVCLARLVLGVHYAVDVVAGIAIGLGYLAVFVWPARRRTRTAFRVTAVVAVVGALVGSPTFDDALMVGGSLGALAAWELLGARVPAYRTTGRTGLLVSIVGLVVLGGVFGATYAVKPPLVVTGLAAAVVLAGLLSLPLLGERLENTTAASMG